MGDGYLRPPWGQGSPAQRIVSGIIKDLTSYPEVESALLESMSDQEREALGKKWERRINQEVREPLLDEIDRLRDGFLK